MPGSIAPLTMAFQRRMAGSAGPLSASGEASNENPVQIEFFLNGAWTDVTSYVMVRDENGNVSITRGRRDEGSQTEQSTCQLTLNNRDGRWSPRYPAGPYYGVIGRNTPVRISVPNGLGGKSYRFQGEISTWPQSWDPTGTDVWTEVEGNGILRRLAQGPPSANSVMYTALITPISANLRAYWPCEDPENSIQVSTPIVTGSPMTYTKAPAFASYEGFPSSDPVLTTAGTTLSGNVGSYTDPTATQVRFFCYIPPDGLINGTVVCSIDQDDYAAGATQFWELYFGSFDGTGKSFTLRTCASDGSNLGADLVHSLDVRGKMMYVSVEFQESGTSINRAIRIYDLTTGNTYSVTDTAANTQLTRVKVIQFGPASRSAIGPTASAGISAVAIGHVTVEDVITSVTTQGVHLNPIGEAAGRRIQRICGEQGIAFEWFGDLDDTVDMGNQGKLNPLSLMQEAELADVGMLYESMPFQGLGYRTRISLCNQEAQLTLDYAGYNLSEIPTPVEDDRYIQNKVTVTVNSISETYELTVGDLSTQLPPTGVGVYGDDVTLNLSSTGDALSQAAWRVHMGTVDEPRYPKISVNLAHSSFVNNPALKQAVLGLKQGDRIVVQNPPFWLPPGNIDQIILGFEETVNNFEHQITFVCAPASPYRVGVMDDVLARIDTDGSQLAGAVTSTDANLTVATTAGPAWIQSSQLNINPRFEMGLSGWVGSGATLARVATPGTAPFVGQWSMQITPDGVSQFPNGGSEQIAVTAGQQYTLSGWLMCVRTRRVDLNINWFDSTHTYLSTTSNDQPVTANTWTFFQMTTTAPVGAAYANLAPTVTNFPPASDVLYADEVIFRLASDTSSSNFPFDILVGGEIVRVGAIGPAVSDTFTRTTASGWGDSETGQTWITNGGVATDYSTDGNYGMHSISAVNSSRYTILPITLSSDMDVRTDVATNALASGAQQYAHVIARYIDINNAYFARVSFNANQTLTLVIQKRVNGAQSDLITVAIPGTHAVNTFFTLRFQVQGSTLQAKCWQVGTTEPDWQATVTDNSISAPGSVGVRSVLDSANTNTLPVTFSYDNFQITNPQTFTVTRSINGVVKPQTAGTDVRLAYPTIISL